MYSKCYYNGALSSLDPACSTDHRIPTAPSPSAASQRLKASNQSLNGSLASSRGGSSRPSSALFDSSPVSVDSKANGVLIHSVDRSASLNSKKGA